MQGKSPPHDHFAADKPLTSTAVGGGSAIWLLEYAAAAIGVFTTTEEIRKACYEVTGVDSSTSTGPVAEMQRVRLISAAAQRIGIHVRPMQLTVEQAALIATPTAPLLAYSPAHQCWIAYEEERGPYCYVTVLDGPQIRLQRMHVKDLQSALGGSDGSTPIVWLSLDQLAPAAALASRPQDDSHGHASATAAHGDSHHHADHAHTSPMKRLIGLLYLERKDIWVLVVFAVWIGVLGLVTPIAVEALVDSVGYGAVLQPVVVLAALVGGFLGFAAILDGVQKWVMEYIERRVFVRVVSDLANRLPRVSVSAFDREHGPEVVNRFFDIMTIQKSLATLLLDGVTLFLNAMIGLVILGFYHPFLLGFDLVLLASVSSIVFGLGRGGVRTSIQESYSKYAVADWLEQLARNPAMFKQAGAAGFAFLRTDALTRHYLKQRHSHFLILFRQICSVLSLQVLASTVLLGMGGFLVITTELTLGQLVAAQLILTVVLGSFAKMDKQLESFYDLMAALDKVGHMIDLPTERNDGATVQPSEKPAAVSAEELSFSYHAGHPVFDHLQFSISAGERVAVVGPSGSGKSTLCDLLFGLRNPTSGHVEYDSMDLREVNLESYRGQVSLVRDVAIVTGTITENVTLQRTSISPTRVREALIAVGLLNEILRLPAGLATHLSLDGAPLSQGQVRRLMIARAIASQPRLLVLDEALDLIDVERLGTVLDTIFDRSAPWTLVVVTHEERIASRCDRCLLLMDGHFRNANDEGVHDSFRRLTEVGAGDGPV